VYIVVAKWPHIEKIEVVDVATPMTTEHFTSNGHGYHAPISAMALALFTGRRLRRYPGSNTSAGSDNGPTLVGCLLLQTWEGMSYATYASGMGARQFKRIRTASGLLSANH
jgi:hypothetical protein